MENKGVIGGIIALLTAIIGLVTLIITRGPSLKETNEKFARLSREIDSIGIEAKPNVIIEMKKLAEYDPRIQWDVVEKLSSLIRTKSPASSKLNIQAEHKPKVPEYIATALKVLKERKLDRDRKGVNGTEHQTIIDLKKVNLIGTDLEQAQFPGVDLSHSDLTNAVLTNANLKGSYLRGTYLRGASLRGVVLVGAQLQKADLFTAVLKDADLSGADLTGANFTPEQIRQARNWDRAIDKTGRLAKIKGE